MALLEKDRELIVAAADPLLTETQTSAHRWPIEAELPSVL